MTTHDELVELRTENTRLIALLEFHGIEWRLPPPPIAVAVQEPELSRLSTAEKVALFRRLFRGRTDVYPVRWEGKTSGKSGYAPACANEWRTGVCEKPRIKCGDCSNRLLMPLSDAVIYDHLAGEHTVGIYGWCPSTGRQQPIIFMQCGPRRLCATQADGGAGVRHHQVGDGIPPVPAARTGERPERMDAGLSGVEFEAHGRIASTVAKQDWSIATSWQNDSISVQNTPFRPGSRN